MLSDLFHLKLNLLQLLSLFFVLFKKTCLKNYPLEVGRITKQWTGLVKEAFTDADNFGINFPIDLDVKVSFMPK